MVLRHKNAKESSEFIEIDYFSAIHRRALPRANLRTGYPQTFPCIDILIPLSCVARSGKPYMLGFWLRQIVD